jgi:hypothetical protein
VNPDLLDVRVAEKSLLERFRVPDAREHDADVGGMVF